MQMFCLVFCRNIFCCFCVFNGKLMMSAQVKSDKLFNAIQNSNFMLVKQLLEAGANPNRLLLNGITPFHLAVGADSTSSYKYVKLILQYSGNPNVFDTEGLTPLHIAAQWGKADCLQLLLQCGADPTIQDKEGRDTKYFAQDNKNCLIILDEFNESTNDPFSFEVQQINPARLKYQNYCDDCGKIKKGTPVNYNNNITLKTQIPGSKNEMSFSTPPSGRDQLISKQDTETSLISVGTLSPKVKKHNSKVKNEQDLPIIDCSSSSKFPTAKPSTGDRIYLDPGSFNAGIDVTSPDNCYLFVQSHKRPNNMEICDKTVSFSKQPSKSPQCISGLSKDSSSLKSPHSFTQSPSETRSPRNFITLEQRQHMLRGTKKEICKSSPVGLSSPVRCEQKTETTPRLLFNDVTNAPLYSSSKHELSKNNDSSFTFAESTVPLECSNEQTQISDTIGDTCGLKSLHEKTLNKNNQAVSALDVISAERCKQMLKATKLNVEKSSPSSQAKLLPKKTKETESPCNKKQQTIIPELSISDDSFFTFADSTLPLECSNDQTQIATMPSNVFEPEHHPEKFSMNKQSKVRERLQSTCHEDFTDALPESFDVSQISADDQIFVYSDSDGSTLIEHRCIPPKSYSPRSMEEVLSPPIKLSVSCDATFDVSSDSTMIYDWKSLLDDGHEVISGCQYDPDSEETVEIPKHIQVLTNDEIRQKLLGHGQRPGPISCARALYMKRLCLLERGIHLGQPTHEDALFSHELRSLLLGKPLPDSVIDDDHDVRSEFDNPTSGLKWRGGTTKDSFNYLLLDPRVTNKLPNRAKYLSETECLKVFSGAVFYVGKGKKSRPYAHFKEALKKSTTKASSKIQHIHDIWSANCGVISLHVFQNVMACEAFTREAAMIEALGLGHLTNSMRGKCYGDAADWDGPRVRRYGTYLVLKSMQILLLEGERQIRSNQISGKKT
uniref:Ankyrin repeat and LEM domain-containing protein 1-like n=1 Tax=Phallusia mammillata TaxID=59560 RepID=A0A6F9D750_9ASCI|nr:ankyrin repeat and LEM domain-containing protein 1-like [Phallusia mammillata]